jgi:6-phosphogluconolactonase/glucosamine-6-phosphate isomerase/deaminase
MTNPQNNLVINRLADTAEATQAAGEALGNILAQFFESPTLLMLSGGSALKILDFVDEEVLGARLTVAVLDERFSVDPLVNNFAQLQDTDFYIRALERDTSFIGTLPRKNDTKENLALRFEAALKNWQQENPQGFIVATLGMGSDGHTAGIMPFPKNPDDFKKMFNGNKWVAAYDAGDKNPFRERITTTLPFLRTVDKAVGFIVGEEKKPALDRVLTKRDLLEQYPAMIFWEMKDLKIFTDIK